MLVENSRCPSSCSERISGIVTDSRSTCSKTCKIWLLRSPRWEMKSRIARLADGNSRTFSWHVPLICPIIFGVTAVHTSRVPVIRACYLSVIRSYRNTESPIPRSPYFTPSAITYLRNYRIAELTINYVTDILPFVLTVFVISLNHELPRYWNAGMLHSVFTDFRLYGFAEFPNH